MCVVAEFGGKQERGGAETLQPVPREFPRFQELVDEEKLGGKWRENVPRERRSPCGREIRGIPRRASPGVSHGAAWEGGNTATDFRRILVTWLRGSAA